MDLVTRSDQARRDFETHPVALDALANGMSVERYRKLLLELYQIVWHFNPVCGAAASRIPDSLRQVRYFLYEHMQEESGHEQWVSNDLEAIAVPAAMLNVHRPTPSTLALIGYNYWSADRRHPCSVLGMLYSLEVIASVYGGAFASAVREALLLGDERGISFIGSHATLDAEHMKHLREILNTVEDDDAHEAIVESALVNFEFVTRIFAAV
ncbi:MAG: iron-containing redox enzyme family protein [Caldimonas sp.]